MPLANLPPVGTLYIPNFNGISWTQPGGPGTKVFPAQKNGPWADYPVPGQFFSETTGIYVAGCGHWQNMPRIFFDHDNMLNQDLALVCCAMCTYIQYTMPQAQFYDPIANPITLI